MSKPTDEAVATTQPTTTTTGDATTTPATTTATATTTVVLPKSVAALEPAPAGELRDTPLTVRTRLPRPTPRFDISGGAFLQSRGLGFNYYTDEEDGPPSYEDSVKGFAFAAAVYPFPMQNTDGRLSGIGFSLKIGKSVGSTMVAADETGYGEYEVQHTALDVGVHYRHLIDKFAVEGEVAYGAWDHTIVDLPETIAVPDTAYQYLSFGGHAEVYPTERASIGATVKYLAITSEGDVTAEDWYGAADAHGWLVGGDLVIPLPANLSLRGAVEWRKITCDFEGSGELSYWWGVDTMEDTSLTGTAQIGIQF